MSPIIIQVCTFSGHIIEKARWEIEFPSIIQEGQIIAINIPFKDPALLGYLTRHPSPVCMIDKNQSGYNVGLSFQVKQIRHMIDISGKEAIVASSMATINPVNRLVESIVLYLLDQTKCDQKFVNGIRGDAKASG